MNLEEVSSLFACFWTFWVHKERLRSWDRTQNLWLLLFCFVHFLFFVLFFFFISDIIVYTHEI